MPATKTATRFILFTEATEAQVSLESQCAGGCEDEDCHSPGARSPRRLPEHPAEGRTHHCQRHRRKSPIHFALFICLAWCTVYPELAERVAEPSISGLPGRRKQAQPSCNVQEAVVPLPPSLASSWRSGRRGPPIAHRTNPCMASAPRTKSWCSNPPAAARTLPAAGRHRRRRAALPRRPGQAAAGVPRPRHHAHRRRGTHGLRIPAERPAADDQGRAEVRQALLPGAPGPHSRLGRLGTSGLADRPVGAVGVLASPRRSLAGRRLRPRKHRGAPLSLGTGAWMEAKG